MDERNREGPEGAELHSAEAMISRLPGVEAARIISSPQGEIEEVHVLACGERGAKQIVRDVESIFSAKFGRTVDHKKVSVAQVGDGPVYREELRLNIESISITYRGEEFEVSIGLAYGGKKEETVARGKRTESNQKRLVVQAGLECASRFLEGCSLALDHIRTLDMNGRKVVLVSVVFAWPGKEELLLGSAFADYDLLEGALKAALKAINRRFSFFVAPGGTRRSP